MRLLGQARTITDLTLVMLSKGFGAKWLNQQSVRNATLWRIPPCLPQLRRLELACSPDLAADYLRRFDAGVNGVEDNYAPLRYLSQLSELTIYGGYVTSSSAAWAPRLYCR